MHTAAEGTPSGTAGAAGNALNDSTVHAAGAKDGAATKQDANLMPFEEARVVARALRLANRTEWSTWCEQGSCPNNVPPNPDAAYKRSGWQGWAHWLGTVTEAANRVLAFEEARSGAHELGLVSLRPRALQNCGGNCSNSKLCAVWLCLGWWGR